MLVSRHAHRTSRALIRVLLRLRGDREAERLLASAGVRTTPFLPSLLHEAELGFDVGFQLPGTVLMLQFKLGQSLTRFHRKNGAGTWPILQRPFWRFSVDTAEPDGQFELLLKAEQDGASAFYVAPCFHDWDTYLGFYADETVLQKSLLLSPSLIRSRLEAAGEPDGPHRVVYDRDRAYVCSEPLEVEQLCAADLADKVVGRLRGDRQTLDDVVRRLLLGFDDRQSVRRSVATQPRLRDGDPSLGVGRAEAEAFWLPGPAQRRRDRRQRIEDLRSRARTSADADALALGIEAWAAGVQLLLVTEAVEQ